MITTDILIDYVRPNPWQPRESEDAEHIKNLALSIAEDGLMQLPVGRLLDADGNPCGINDALKYADVCETVPEAWEYILKEMGCTVQLAFGHSRLAAYKWLAANFVGDWSKMPVVLRDLDDETMFRMAITENVQRKDLSPMEEARAMLRFRDEFGKTSAQIGELFGLAESSVRNKMRLMGLPEQFQTALACGLMNEGAARELLTLFEMPADVQKRAESVRDPVTFTFGSVVKIALSGRGSEQVRELITQAVKDTGRDLSGAMWKWDQAYDCSIEGNESETCKSCKFHITREKHSYCVKLSCWQTRERLAKMEVLARASAATGIRVIEDPLKTEYDFTRLETDQAQEIRASGCENLRLVYVDSVPNYKQAGMVDGHPKCLVMCSRQRGRCTCSNGIAARAKLEAAGIRVEKAVTGQPAHLAPIVNKVGPSGELPGQMKISASAQDLKDMASQARRAKKQLTEEVKAMQDDFAKRVASAFENRNGRVMAELLLSFVYSTERYKYQNAMAEEILYKAALHLAESTYDFNYYTTPDLGEAVKRFNEFLRGAQLSEMSLAIEHDEPIYEPVEVSEYEPAADMAVRQCKPLIDVFQDEEDQQFRQVMDTVIAGDLLPGQMPGETLAAYFSRTDGE